MTLNHPAWRAEPTIESSGVCLRIKGSDGYLSFATVFELFLGSPAFRGWYSDLLVASDSKAIYWEHPSLTRHTVSLPYEVALIDAHALAAIRADSRPFDGQFAASPGLDVAAFDNLGGDATLIAPKPTSPNADYAHLLSFLRTANKPQIDALWQRSAASLLEILSPTPVWLSTAGGGVNWLHVRIDAYPKYYKHPRYRRPG